MINACRITAQQHQMQTDPDCKRASNEVKPPEVYVVSLLQNGSPRNSNADLNVAVAYQMTIDRTGCSEITHYRRI